MCDLVYIVRERTQKLSEGDSIVVCSAVKKG